MATIVDGMVMGVRMYGEVNAEDFENLGKLASAMEDVRKALATLFNAEVADMAVRRAFGDTNLEIRRNSEVENLAEWQDRLHNGIVFCHARGSEIETPQIEE